jgi:hypothetical protein
VKLSHEQLLKKR